MAILTTNGPLEYLEEEEQEHDHNHDGDNGPADASYAEPNTSEQSHPIKARMEPSIIILSRARQ